jgi:hypothetical protein
VIVDIGGIVDNHCLFKLSFHKYSLSIAPYFCIGELQFFEEISGIAICRLLFVPFIQLSPFKYIWKTVKTH